MRTAIRGANKFRELGSTLPLADEERLGAITLRFLRAASISGHVYDSDSEPVADASVSLLRPGRSMGAPVLVQYRGTSTDDRGEYRFSNIDPGQYYIRARTIPFSLGSGSASGFDGSMCGRC